MTRCSPFFSGSVRQDIHSCCGCVVSHNYATASVSSSVVVHGGLCQDLTCLPLPRLCHDLPCFPPSQWLCSWLWTSAMPIRFIMSSASTCKLPKSPSLWMSMVGCAMTYHASLCHGWEHVGCAMTYHVPLLHRDYDRGCGITQGRSGSPRAPPRRRSASVGGC